MFKPEDLKEIPLYNIINVLDYLDVKFSDLVEDQWCAKYNTNYIYLDTPLNTDLGRAINCYKSEIEDYYLSAGWNSCSISLKSENENAEVVRVLLKK